MLRKLTATEDSSAIAILRLVLGIVFFAHGAQKMLGWFGGYGFSGSMGFMTGTLHIPAFSPSSPSRRNSSAGWVWFWAC